MTMSLTNSELAALICEFFEARTSIYFLEEDDGRCHIDGRFSPQELADWLQSSLDPCPCNHDGEHVAYSGRWTSGRFDGGPLRSAYTCQEHSPLVAAWCYLGTALPPVWVGDTYGTADVPPQEDE